MTKTSPILITGGTGFAGSHLVEALLGSGTPAENIHATSFGSKPSFVHSILPLENIHQVDLSNQGATIQLLQNIQPAQIYHLASSAIVGASFDNIKQVLENNQNIQLSFLEAVKNSTSQAKIVAIGSAMEYAPSSEPLSEISPLGPLNPYGVSKVVQDMLSNLYAKSFGLQIVIARPFNHLGERQTLGFAVPDFCKQIIDIENNLQTEIRVGNLEAKRDFLDVKDVAQSYLTLMEKGQVGEVYNIGSQKSVSMKFVLDLLTKNSTAQIKIVEDHQKMRPSDIPQVIADISKIKSLGWQPAIPLDATLHRTLNWWRQNYKE